jgi:pimeloyl-ACP methyl ester carboxylesterase
MTIPYQTLNIPDDPTPLVIVEQNSDKDWAVLWLQGWRSTIEGHFETIEKLAHKSNMTFAMIDYAGFGQHSTPLPETTRERQHFEVVAAYDELKRRGYKNIIASGNSFGSYMSALLASKRELAGVILRAPAIYDDQEFTVKQKDRDDAAYQAFKKSIHPESPLAALHAIHSYNGPVYVFEHGADEVIPRNIPQSYFANAAQGSYLYIHGAPHTPKTTSEPQKYYDYIETAIISVLALLRQQNTTKL